MDKSYSELMKLGTFKERFDYLKQDGRVGEDTFGYDRIFNQIFYTSKEWKIARNKAIARDNGLDMGVKGYDISGPIYVHHINPLTMEDIVNSSPKLFDLENLISTSRLTHTAIHYSDDSILPQEPIVRTANDTCPWKK